MVKLGRIMLFVSDMPRMRAFYRAVIERDPTEDEPGWVVFETDAGQVALHAVPPEYATKLPDPAPPRTDVALKFVLVVDDLAATHARMQALSRTIRELHTHGTRSFFDVIDPEGNVFQLASR